MEIGPIFRALTRHRARSILIVAEVALTLAIVANCVSMIRDARASMARESGFDDDNLIYVRTQPFAEAFNEAEYRRAVIDDDLRRMRAMPGVRAASTTGFLPWAGGGSSFEIKIAGGPETKFRSQFYTADPQIFKTLGVNIIEGRNFTAQELDTGRMGCAQCRSAQPADTTANIVVTKALADLMFPGGSAVGKLLQDPDETEAYTIVGVIDRFYNPYGWPIHEYACFFPGRLGVYLVRAEAGKAEALIPRLERVLLGANDGRNLRVMTITEVRSQYHARDQALVTSLNGVMILLVGVTALGIIGITSFSVAERRRQIGTRRALGATRGAILRHFLFENWLVTTFGAVLGLGLAVALNIGLVTLVEGARIEWPILAGGVALLWTVGLLAALGPAWRASQVAPAIATRNV
jgi:putative ABC transport system permease protein